MESFDIAIIGAGPGGYVSAIRAAQLGNKVVLIEKGNLGGVCLNSGCIPTKFLTTKANLISKINNSQKHNIFVKDLSFDYAKIKEQKDKTIGNIRANLQNLLKSNKITIIKGHASFITSNEIKITGEKDYTISCKKTIIATGSKSIDSSLFPCDHKKIYNSTSILNITTLPKKMAIIGGGYIGCEFASVFSNLGVNVTIIEALPTILQQQGKTISNFLTSVFKEKNIDIKTNARINKIEKKDKGVQIDIGDEKINSDIVLVSIGRKANTDLDLKNVFVQTDEKGFITVNEKMQTTASNIYAIGDAAGKTMLAHVASHEGMIAAENASGQNKEMKYVAIPSVIFTDPEIASIGMTLEEASKAYQVKLGNFPFRALGKAISSMDEKGFAQIIVDDETKEILGAQVAGEGASNMIAEIALAMSNELTLDCITETIHPHPTISEAWMEAAFLAKGMPIHFPPKKS